MKLTWWVRAISPFVAVIFAIVEVIASLFVADASSIITGELATVTRYKAI